MFERFTQGARRVIFFARNEASNYGSPYIETEHLLLGLLREDQSLANRLAKEHIVEPGVRAEIERRITRREPFSTSVEVPLSNECKNILKFAADAVKKLGHRWVGTEHLLMGILQADTSSAAQILISRGLKPQAIQEQVAKAPGRQYEATATFGGQFTLEAFLAGLKCLNKRARNLMNGLRLRIGLSVQTCFEHVLQTKLNAANYSGL
jgi:ATP-dependent Clp protease ATP-binding subunit ClpC